MLFGDVCAGVLTHCTIYQLIVLTFCIGVVARHITKIVFFKRKIIVKFKFCLVNIIINIFYFGMKKRWPTAKEDLKQRRERSADFMIYYRKIYCTYSKEREFVEIGIPVFTSIRVTQLC